MMRRSQASAIDVASLRAIQGKRKHALIERGEEIRCTSVQGGDCHQCFPIHVAQTKIIQFAIFHTSRSTRALAELAMTQGIPFLGRRRRSLRSDFSTAVHTAATRAYVRTFGRVRDAGRRASPGKALFRPSETLTLRSATDRPGPFAALRDRRYERAGRARKRSSAEGVRSSRKLVACGWALYPIGRPIIAGKRLAHRIADASDQG
jgi:hypothetical protein